VSVAVYTTYALIVVFQTARSRCDEILATHADPETEQMDFHTLKALLLLEDKKTRQALEHDAFIRPMMGYMDCSQARVVRDFSSLVIPELKLLRTNC